MIAMQFQRGQESRTSLGSGYCYTFRSHRQFFEVASDSDVAIRHIKFRASYLQCKFSIGSSKLRKTQLGISSGTVLD